MHTKVADFDSTLLITHLEKPPKGAGRLSCLAGLVAGGAYSVYATFIAQALTPPSVYVIDRSTHRRLLPGQIGDLEEVFYWDGLIRMLVLSIIVFILAWCIVRVAAKCAGQLSVSVPRTRPTNIGASTDRAAMDTTPIAITAWSAMPTTGITSMSIGNMDRVIGAADSGFESRASCLKPNADPFVGAGQTRANQSETATLIGARRARAGMVG
jgi:hypothetical protein